MAHTTIAIRKDLKDKISTFGNKGESYSEIIDRIYEVAIKTQIKELLMNEKNTISAKEALEKAKKRWRR